MNKNKGFSLVELIVALAIFAIAGAAIFGFTVYSSNNYSRTNADVKLQYEQQLAVNQIRDAILEASNGIYYDSTSNSLFIYSESTNSTGAVVYPVTKISFNSTEMNMYMATKSFASIDDINLTTITEDKLLAEDVKEFSVDLSKVKKDKVSFSITFSINDKDVTVSPIIALRNHLQVSEDLDSIYSGSKTEVLSFIKSIQISRGSTIFTQGATDTVGKTDANQVVVKYSAIVTATQDSIREYTVEWSISPEISGVSVDKTTGVLTIAKTVADNTTFTLTATSVDEPAKYASIIVRVIGDGVYPKKVVLTDPPEYDKTGNGFWLIEIAPTITYTNNTTSNKVSLLDWEGIKSLPEGCRYWLDEDKNVLKLSLTEKANGKTFTIYAKTKDLGADGESVKSNEVVIAIGPNDIPPYVSGPILNVAAPNNFERGGVVNPGVNWQNATSSNYTYHWTIEPYQDDSSAQWNTADNTKTSFNKITVKNTNCSNIVATRNKITCTTSSSYRNITLKCDSNLDWSKTFKYKVNVTAVNNKDGSEVVAKEQIGTIPPVSITLTPIERISGEDTEYLTSNVIKYNRFNRNYGQRLFFVDYTGLFVNGNNTISNYQAKEENVFCFYGMNDNFGTTKIKEGPTCYPTRQAVQFDINLNDYRYDTPMPVRFTYCYRVSVYQWVNGKKITVNRAISEPLEYTMIYE